MPVGNQGHLITGPASPHDEIPTTAIEADLAALARDETQVAGGVVPTTAMLFRPRSSTQADCSRHDDITARDT